MEHTESKNDDLLAQFLTPGSSRYPLWIALLHGAFAALLCVFLGLLWMTGGNFHIFVLIGIEVCLWASVQWFLYELQKAPLPASEQPNSINAINATENMESKKDQ
ncbi:hypothetical protein M407DRAFT_241289 [Tulasnella calospora MUT 4182]|uniref:Uncharacterized protein n=1 Tax=Tulasnella calospora MUT 4182 TaxID=1051891 RepID=A0A0C3LG00_9AGAM|nr:hypothetical protein M407DRAFT_241289 [Tulasnella calospora MUT 4182]